MPLLRTNGFLVLITDMKKPVMLSAEGFMQKRCSVGFEFMFARILQNDEPEYQRELLQQFSWLIDSGVISPRVLDSNKLKITELPKAFELQASGELGGQGRGGPWFSFPASSSSRDSSFRSSLLTGRSPLAGSVMGKVVLDCSEWSA